MKISIKDKLLLIIGGVMANVSPKKREEIKIITTSFLKESDELEKTKPTYKVPILKS